MSWESLEPAQLQLGLGDPEPRIREQAARLAEPRITRDAPLLQAVLGLADDPDPMVRFQTALSLGECASGSPDDPGAGGHCRSRCR